jgi:prolyl oligopeptidase
VSNVIPPASLVGAPTVDMIHGVPVSDPFRWLEDQDSARTRQWLAEQALNTRTYFDSLANRPQLVGRIQELLASELIDGPRMCGSQVFFTKRQSCEEHAAITMRNTLQGHDIPLLRPSDLREAFDASVDIVGISRNGALLAFGIRTGGEDYLQLGLLDVERRAILPDRIPRGIFRGLVFSRSGEALIYSHSILTDHVPAAPSVCWHAIGAPFLDDLVVFKPEHAITERIAVLGAADSEYVAYLARRAGEPRRSDLYVQEIDLSVPARLVLEGIEGRFLPRVSGNTVICLRFGRAPNGEIVALNLRGGDGTEPRIIVPQCGAKIQEFVLTNSAICVRYVWGIETSVQIYDHLGNKIGRLQVPVSGTTRFFTCVADSDSFFYKCSSPSTLPTIHNYNTRSSEDRTWAVRALPVNVSLIREEYLYSTSKDGVSIPVTLIYRDDSRRAQRSLPTVLTAYGGFGDSITPQFSIFASCLTELGCLYAVANIRGGSEFGESWHDAGRRRKRQTSIDDFLATAEWLVSSGLAFPGRLAIVGGSNAGLLVAAALTQRPDLFCAVVCIAPLTDMVRYHLFDQARSWIEEYGHSENVEDFPFLLGYSPYHNVRDNTNYPPVLIVSGDADTRCNPMHARKLAARLQSANVSGNPILLSYTRHWGHMASQTLRLRVEALTDRVSFLCHHLGLSAQGGIQ